MKYGVRLHWGLYSILRLRNESWPFLSMSFEERQRYQEMYRTWNPREFDADAWMNLFAECGMRMFAFTSKHHDGFSMFNTGTRVRGRANWTAPGRPRLEDCDLAYSIAETPFRRDVVGELCAAARKRGLKIDLYFSHPDWYDADFRPYNCAPLQVPSSATLDARSYPDVPKKLGDRIVTVPDPTPAEVNRMMARHRAQLSELLTNYGQIDMLCLDQWLGPSVWPQLRDTILHLRKLQPDVMLRARGIGNYGDYYTPEGFVPGNKENTDTPWFVIYPLGSSFSYESDASLHKGSQWIVQQHHRLCGERRKLHGGDRAGRRRAVSSHREGATSGRGGLAAHQWLRHLCDAREEGRPLAGRATTFVSRGQRTAKPSTLSLFPGRDGG